MPSQNASYRELPGSNYAGILHEMPEQQPDWHVLWTKSNYERIVHDHLASKRYEVFLPMISQWMKRKKGLPTVDVPMFKGYLFIRHAIDKRAYLDISNTKGLVNILGHSWDRLGTIPEPEIQAIRQLTDSRLPVSPYPYLKSGTRVRITRGAMQNAQGILVRSDVAKGIFVISVNLLQRSLSITVDCADVVPV